MSWYRISKIHSLEKSVFDGTSQSVSDDRINNEEALKSDAAAIIIRILRDNIDVKENGGLRYWENLTKKIVLRLRSMESSEGVQLWRYMTKHEPEYLIELSKRVKRDFNKVRETYNNPQLPPEKQEEGAGLGGL